MLGYRVPDPDEATLISEIPQKVKVAQAEANRASAEAGRESARKQAEYEHPRDRIPAQAPEDQSTTSSSAADGSSAASS